jgi:hypothetical protein
MQLRRNCKIFNKLIAYSTIQQRIHFQEHSAPNKLELLTTLERIHMHAAVRKSRNHTSPKYTQLARQMCNHGVIS